jgi:hypothetical protein
MLRSSPINFSEKKNNQTRRVNPSSKTKRRNKKTTQRRGIKMDQKNKGNYFQVKNTIFSLIYADKYPR